MTITLREVVDRYLAVGSDFQVPVALSALGFSREQVEGVFSAFDEDYHISRYLHFDCADGVNYQIGGFSQTHVAIDAEIQSIL